MASELLNKLLVSLYYWGIFFFWSKKFITASYTGVLVSLPEKWQQNWYKNLSEQEG